METPVQLLCISPLKATSPELRRQILSIVQQQPLRGVHYDWSCDCHAKLASVINDKQLRQLLISSFPPSPKIKAFFPPPKM